MQQEIEQAYQRLFAEIREDLKKSIRARAYTNNVSETFSVRGNWRDIFRVSMWREKVDRIVRPVIRRLGLNSRQADAHIEATYRAADTYAQNITDAVTDLATSASSVEELVRAVDDIAWVNRADIWAENQIWSLDQNLRLNTAIREGKTKKRWVTQDDERVRQSPAADHVMMHNVVVPVNAKFQLITGQADFPMDPSLGLADIVNCRCYLIYE